MRPDADVTDGGWTDQDGGTSLFAAIDEDPASNADYIKSSGNPVDDICQVSMSDPGTSPNMPLEVQYRYWRDGAGTINLVARLKQGGTTIATWTHNGISTTPVDATQALSSGEFNSITDFNDLRVEFEADAA
jgi:hypothetical protein